MPKTPNPTRLAGKHVILRDQLVTEENGRLALASSPLLYGLAAYTVMSMNYRPASKEYVIFRFEDHLKRLQESAKIVGMVVDKSTLAANNFSRKLTELLHADDIQEDVLVRCTLFTDAMIAGTTSHGLTTSLSMYAYINPQFYPSRGIDVCVSSWRRTPDVCIPSRAKINGSYINSSLMKNQALMDGYDDAIALDMDGHVAESTVANIFIIRNGTLITPDASADILEGITRDTVIEWAKQQNLPLIQRPIDRTELYIADEVFLTGTTAKVTPVLSIDRRPVGTGQMGPLTRRIQKDYLKILAGSQSICPGWLTVL